MKNKKKVLEVSLLEHKLNIKTNSNLIKNYDIATGKYSTQPKYWGWDYKTPIGRYFVKEIYERGSKELTELNSKYYPWYLTHKFRNTYEDAGKGVYGDGIIVLDYPNLQDVNRFLEAKKSGLLNKEWIKFCERHWKPMYEYFAKEKRVDFYKILINGDFGQKTYKALIENFPISNPSIAFNSRIIIHGTNDPACIGHNISGGCIRIHNKDIEELIERHVQKGVEVRIFFD